MCGPSHGAGRLPAFRYSTLELPVNPDPSRRGAVLDLPAQTGLGETLSGNGPFTVFAPTNEAFAKIPPAQLQAILADKALLTKILTYHVVPDRVLSKDLRKRQSVDTVEGNAVEIIKKKKGAFIEDARITQTDLKGSNGVVHVIDTVILPPDV